MSPQVKYKTKKQKNFYLLKCFGFFSHTHTLAQWILTILASQECQQFSAYLFQYPLCARLSLFFFSSFPRVSLLKGSLQPALTNFLSASQITGLFPPSAPFARTKTPRNPAACPQLIFPVAILLTQPPTGRGCKCKSREQASLCATPHHRHNLGPPLPPHFTDWGHSGEAEVSITAGGSKGGVWTTARYQHQGLFSLTPACLLIKQHHPLHQTWTPQSIVPPPPDFLLHLPLPVCFCLSNLSCVLRQWSVALTGRRYRSGGRKMGLYLFHSFGGTANPPRKYNWIST